MRRDRRTPERDCASIFISFGLNGRRRLLPSEVRGSHLLTIEGLGARFGKALVGSGVGCRTRDPAEA
jgi:hypothetical protein